MNKILLDKEKIELENIEAIIEGEEKKYELIFKGNNKIEISPKKDINLTIILQDKANLDLKIFLENTQLNTNLNIIQYNNTNFIFRESLSAKNDIKIKINNQIMGHNNTSKISLRCLSLAQRITIDVLALALKDSCDNEIIEDIKGLNEGGIVTILPKMEINTNEVIANHYVSIGNVSKEDLFYLKSKGLSEEVAKTLILKGFLKEIMEVMDDE